MTSVLSVIMETSITSGTDFTELLPWEVRGTVIDI